MSCCRRCETGGETGTVGIATGFEYVPGTMTGEHLEAILKVAGAKSEKDGWTNLPEGATLTLHVAHGGTGMTVSRIESLKRDGELLYARNTRRELFALASADVYAVALDGEPAAGKVARRAGFG
jgi:hypothetical protein